VYALAALYSVGNAKLRSLVELANELSTPLNEQSSDPTKKDSSTRVTWGNDGGFINGWRP